MLLLAQTFSGSRRNLLEVIGIYWKLLEVIGNHWRSLGGFGKPWWPRWLRIQRPRGLQGNDDDPDDEAGQTDPEDHPSSSTSWMAGSQRTRATRAVVSLARTRWSMRCGATHTIPAASVRIQAA